MSKFPQRKCIFFSFFFLCCIRYNRYYDSCFCFIFKMHQNILSNPDFIIPRVETIHLSQQVSKGEDYLQLTDACYSMGLLHTKAQTCTTYPRPWYVVVAITMVIFIYRKMGITSYHCNVHIDSNNNLVRNVTHFYG